VRTYKPPVPTENVVGTTKVSKLESQLYEAAKNAARNAVQTHTDPDGYKRLTVAISCGGALEYMMRSVVCGLDPILLAEPGNVPSQLALSSAVTGSSMNPIALKTATIKRVHDVLIAFHPTFVTAKSNIDDVMNIRNAAAHMAFESAETVTDAVTKMVRVVSALHDLSGKDEASFWGDLLITTVTEMKVLYENALKIRVESKLAYARSQLALLITGLSTEDAEAVRVMRERRVIDWDLDEPSEEQPRKCPACERVGALFLLRERETSQYEIVEDYDRDGVIENAYMIVPVTGEPMHFQCPVCGLQLEPDEMTLYPDLGDSVQLDSEVLDDPSEVYGWHIDD
jgi:hypothetical protein